ncbi:MAG TPA: 2-C-methyl-D-erythritol 2,4-cyclodiphosphate synthase, partial [Bacillales bacterium]|nr:2-C-methyl-D-erythritol 2,4-cyclodiphosphate synthase [Bacillales bacterium]
MRIGHGFDVHRLSAGRQLIIGGVDIPYEKGLMGHSDADVLLHAISDALLGAAALGDIGRHFPDTDPAFKNADSKELLAHVYTLLKEKGYTCGNVDATIMAERPKLAPYIERMRAVLAGILQIDIDRINVKATTTEKLGFAG